MIPSVSQVCTLNSPFESDIEEFAEAGLRAIEIWLTKLEVYAAKKTPDEIKQLFADNSICASIASFQGGLLAAPSEKRNEARSLFAERIALCKKLGIETIVVACDVKMPFGDSDLLFVNEGLTEIAKVAERSDVRIAIEFQSRSAFGNNLQTAAALIEQANSSHLGICFDAFHFYTGPSKEADLAYLNQGNLFHVQLSDLIDVPRELATDSDRIVPGDGDFDLSTVIRHLRRIDYQDCVSMELMNPRFWQISPRQIGEIGVKAIQRLCE